MPQPNYIQKGETGQSPYFEMSMSLLLLLSLYLFLYASSTCVPWFFPFRYYTEMSFHSDDPYYTEMFVATSEPHQSLKPPAIRDIGAIRVRSKSSLISIHI